MNKTNPEIPSTEQKKRPGILFDLDGTLWDSAKPVAKAWSLQLESEGYGKDLLSAEDMYAVMGFSMDEVAKRLLPFLEGEKRRQTARRCERFENEYLHTQSNLLYPGVQEMLEDLKKQGYVLGIVSNCQEGYIEAFLDGSKLNDLFEDYECYGHTQKPKSENIRLTAERSHLDPVFYVGDTIMDQKAAQEAGVPFIHAAYGFGTTDARYAIQKPDELTELMINIMNEQAL